MVKNLPASSEDARDIGSSSGLGRSPGWQPSPLVLPEKFHGQKSLVGYSPWDHKESDTTKRLSMHPHVSLVICLRGGDLYVSLLLVSK